MVKQENKNIDMIDIKIDDMNYHKNTLSQEELKFVNDIYKNLLSKYTDLSEFINQELKNTGLNEKANDKLILQVITAFCHTIKISYTVNSIDDFYRLLNRWLKIFLPIIVKNINDYRGTHPVQFEPIVVTIIYMAYIYRNSIKRYFKENTINKNIESYESYVAREIINLTRTIKSSIMLFTVGDDVHGISLFRGAMEIYARLTLSKDFKEEYVKFKKYSFYLSLYREKGIPMPREVYKKLNEYPEYQKNAKSFLTYGWAKNKNGKRIQSLKMLVKEVFDDENADAILTISNELVHENYVSLNYDFIKFRRYMLENYFDVFNDLILDDSLTEDEKELLELNNLKQLFSEAKYCWKKK